MSGSDLLLDTNICIYLLNGDDVLAELLQDQNISISIITEMELCSYHSDNKTARRVLKEFLAAVVILNITEVVKTNAIKLRKDFKLKLPDAIIAATAISYGYLLVSADKAFEKIVELDLLLYRKNKS